MDTVISSLPVALGVLGYLAYQDWRDGKFKKKPEGTIDEVIQKMGGDMSHLRMHFNDDLTRILTEMQIAQSKSNEVLSQIVSTQNEMLKYGIKCRKD